MMCRDHLGTVCATVVACILGCGGGGGGGDAGTDTGPDDPAPDTVGDVDAPDDALDASDDGNAEPPPDVEDVDAADADTEEAGPVCGDGVLDTGEVCDDGNTEHEDCETTDATACLADCSLRMARCGDGVPDEGEQCDDGNDDEYDDCTSSCTINDHGIGAPCECTEGCSPFDFSAGTIVGCEGLEGMGDSTRAVACLYSISEDTFGLDSYASGGYCSLIALGCEGPPCIIAPDVGDVDAFSCPEASVPITAVVEITEATLTMKMCHVTCTSDADCRWAEVEDLAVPWVDTCTQYRCMTLDYSGERVCADVRNPDPTPP